MKGIFYIRHKRKLKQIHTCLVPDDAITFRLIGVAPKLEAKTEQPKLNEIIEQTLSFKRVSIIGDEAMYVFDADKYL